MLINSQRDVVVILLHGMLSSNDRHQGSSENREQAIDNAIEMANMLTEKLEKNEE